MNRSFILSFISPFRMGSGHGRAGLYDHTPLFDSRGWQYVPGSAIKGKLRHLAYRLIRSLADDGVTASIHFAELCPAKEIRFCRGEPCAFCRLFGSPAHQCAYRFEDAHLSDNMDFIKNFSLTDHMYIRSVQTAWRARVSLGRSRRVAKPSHLMFSENGVSYLEFNAHVHGPDDLEVDTLLIYALNCLTHLGAGIGTGLGRVEWQENMV